MARKVQTLRRPAGETPPRRAVIPPDTAAQTSGGFTMLLEKATQEILAVTYWFDPAPQPGPSPVTVSFSGRRVDAEKGRVRPGDRFVQDETIEQIVPGSGPISITTKVHGINAGEWLVTARMQGEQASARRSRKQEDTPPLAAPQGPIARLWRRWAPPVELDKPVHTCLPHFTHVPGIIPLIWGVMVTLGMIVALVLQSLVISADHLAVGPALVVSLIAIAVGVAVAKGWYIVAYRREHLKNGWCIQGFITGATLAAAILLVVLVMPASVFLDVTAPGLLFAMAVGRVGCFFAGCCGGPPTASRFGVWSSDQRVGARRIPTQLMESLLALSLGIVVLVAVLRHGPAGGVYFVGGLVAYTLVRQGILHLRAEPRKTKLGGLVTTVLATLVLIVTVVLLTRSW